jgi:carbon-monoxide dehydrogenase large subunit
VSFRDVATTVYTDSHGKEALPFEPGLETTRYFRIDNVYHQPEVQGRFSSYPTWPNGAAACIVDVDPETGVFKILRYCVVHDCGTVINPLLVTGQLHGGIAQGIGGAVFENLVYDEAGQLMTTTFMDYTCPTAVDLPSFEVDHQETPSPFTPLGAKGAGESGVASPLASLTNAIEDAFRDIGVRITDLPLSPDRIWRAIQEGRARAS